MPAHDDHVHRLALHCDSIDPVFGRCTIEHSGRRHGTTWPGFTAYWCT